MAQPKDNLPIHGVIVHALDLPRMKAFYRDTIQLGAPLADSNFWVQFELPGNGALILEKCNNVVPDQDRRETSWLLPVTDFDEWVARLETCGVRSMHPGVRIPGVRCATFADPEGNPVTIYAKDIPADDKSAAAGGDTRDGDR